MSNGDVGSAEILAMGQVCDTDEQGAGKLCTLSRGTILRLASE